MTSYAEMADQRKKARPLYLELRALGLDVIAHDDDIDPTCYRLELIGAQSLSPACADRYTRRLEQYKPGILRVLWSTWDPTLRAVFEEGRAA